MRGGVGGGVIWIKALRSGNFAGKESVLGCGEGFLSGLVSLWEFSVSPNRLEYLLNGCLGGFLTP